MISMALMLGNKNVLAQPGNAMASLPANYKILKIKPSDADPSIHYWDTAHTIYYDPEIKNNKILLWLTGTGGTSNHVPANFIKMALERGYRVIALSFISIPAGSQICIGDTVAKDADCAYRFRRQRVYGDISFPYIPDERQDAIIPRLIKLLQYLSNNDAGGQWDQYIDENTGKPAWLKIAIAGQSQGGGMGEFIAQQEDVFKVISFSGGWDYSNSKTKEIAGWYRRPCVTPGARWYATYHIQEAAAATLRNTYEALPIPANHVFALDQPLLMSKKSKNPYHTEGVQNPAYQSVWELMLGSGR